MAENRPDKPTEADRTRKDEYDGQYKDEANGKSPEELYGTSLNPVQDTPSVASGMKNAGG